MSTCASPTPRPRSRRTGLTVLLAALAVASLGLLPAGAQAHRVSAAKANAVAKAVANDFAIGLDGARTSDGGTLAIDRFGTKPCTRHSGHTFACPIAGLGQVVYPSAPAADVICAATAHVKYRTHRSKKATVRIAGVSCGITGQSSARGSRGQGWSLGDVR